MVIALIIIACLMMYKPVMTTENSEVVYSMKNMSWRSTIKLRRCWYMFNEQNLLKKIVIMNNFEREYHAYYKRWYSLLIFQ